MKSAAKKTECADGHTEQSGDAVIEGKDSPETPEEQTITFQAIRAGDEDPDTATSTDRTPRTGTPTDDDPTVGDDTTADDGAGPEDGTSPGPEDVEPAGRETADASTGDAEVGDAAGDTAGDGTEPVDVETGEDQAEGAPSDHGRTGASPADTPAAREEDGGVDDVATDQDGGVDDVVSDQDRGANDPVSDQHDGDADDAVSSHDDTPEDAVSGDDDASEDAVSNHDGAPRDTASGAGEHEDEDPVPHEAEGSLFQPARSQPPSQPERPSQPQLPSHPQWPSESQSQPFQRVREVPLPKPVSRVLTAALSGLRDSVTGVRLGLEVPGVEEARKAQAEILAQIGDYVIPRVHMSTAPALIAVVGSTGAGKSTLVNTLAAAKVSATGVRRPTTGTPVLVCHSDDHEWFAKGDVLGGLIRVDRPVRDKSLDSLVLATSERLPQGLALLDTPDIDSVEETHHEVAQRMLDAADLWVFVTTATRYADAPVWNLLRLAKERGARLAIVLSRVPSKSRDVIDKHFSRMLQEYGLGDIERFVVNEATVTGGRLPEEEVAELRMWLTELSVDDQRRSQAVQATLDGVLNSFRNRIPALARHMEAQVAFRAELRTDVDAAYMGALAEIDDSFGNGSLLRGEVLARWQDFAGSGDLMKTLHLRRPGRLATKNGQQTPARLHAFRAALRAGLESMIVSAGQRAAEEVVARWRQRDGAGDRLAATPGLGRPSDEFARRVGRTIGAWQEHVVGLIRSGGVTKRSVAKVLSFDEEALSLVFTMGLLGYGNSDVAASSGTGTLPERLLRGVLGAEALRSIGTKARSDLRARISVLFDEETFRYVQVLDEAGIPDEAAAKRLYQATYNLEVAR
ncbi:dynamin family protein [Sphaerisporangium perillae]|uniref:dynamin family protein n=1 Tax=Sphaerisporangium perillae TaxID=2935860 RepID=UPI00200C6AAF|nr:dynamin family protein [Sphaerisporangium perillae]